MRINVKRIDTGKIITLNVDPDYTIDNVKAFIRTLEGIPRNEQRLIFAGKDLADDLTLAECNIEHNDCIDMLIRLRGGGGRALVKQMLMKKKPVLTTAEDRKLFEDCHSLALKAMSTTSVDAKQILASFTKEGLTELKEYLDHSKDVNQIKMKKIISFAPEVKLLQSLSDKLTHAIESVSDRGFNSFIDVYGKEDGSIDMVGIKNRVNYILESAPTTMES